MPTHTYQEPVLDMETHLALKRWRWAVKDVGTGPGFADAICELIVLMSRPDLPSEHRNYTITLMISDASCAKNHSAAMKAADLIRDPILKTLMMRDIMMDLMPAEREKSSELLKQVMASMFEIPDLRIREMMLTDLQHDRRWQQRFRV